MKTVVSEKILEIDIPSRGIMSRLEHFNNKHLDEIYKQKKFFELQIHIETLQ